MNRPIMFSNIHLRMEKWIFTRLEKSTVDTSASLSGIQGTVLEPIKTDKIDSGVKLLVPVGIEVYQVVKLYRNKEVLFFSSRTDDYSPAYASAVAPINERLSSASDFISLFHYPWFDRDSTRQIYTRLVRLAGNSVLNTSKPNEGRHPLLLQ